MNNCVREKDYMDYIESRLVMGRRIGLFFHSLRCARCRSDMSDWQRLRKLIRRAERQGAGRKVGLADGVMARIRCAQAVHGN